MSDSSNNISLHSNNNQIEQNNHDNTNISNDNNPFISPNHDNLINYNDNENQNSQLQKILTNPSIVCENGFDNLEGNLIVSTNDRILANNDTYIVDNILGVGTFGQVFRCYKEYTNQYCAIKVIKNIPAYYKQGLLEIKILSVLNNQIDYQKHIVKVLDSFEFKSHICVAFELLGCTLLDVLTQNQYRGLPLATIQKVARQLISALIALQDANIIHCDLKPENILLVPKSSSSNNDSKTQSTIDDTSTLPKSELSKKMNVLNSPDDASIMSDIKVIDFGSACFEGKTMFSYIQSRFYRAPEVLVGASYNSSIDMWSFACVCVELYLGLPLFPGVSQHNQLTRIIEMLGPLPDSLIIRGKNSMKYFTKADVNRHDTQLNNRKFGSFPNSPSSGRTNSSGSSTPSQFRLKTASEYARDTRTDVPVFKKYLRYNRLDDIIMKCSLPSKSKYWTQEQRTEEFNKRISFLDFLMGIFRLDPADRWTAKQAVGHPFITNSILRNPYQPPLETSLSDRRLPLYGIHSDSSNRNQSFTSPSDSGISRSIQQKVAFQLNSQDSNNQENFVPSMDSHSSSSGINTSKLSPAQYQQYLDSQTSFESRPILKRGQPVQPIKHETALSQSLSFHSNKFDYHVNDVSQRQELISNSQSSQMMSSFPIPPQSQLIQSQQPYFHYQQSFVQPQSSLSKSYVDGTLMKEGDNMMMTDFGNILHRPDLDEHRRLKSINSSLQNSKSVSSSQSSSYFGSFQLQSSSSNAQVYQQFNPYSYSNSSNSFLEDKSLNSGGSRSPRIYSNDNLQYYGSGISLNNSIISSSMISNPNTNPLSTQFVSAFHDNSEIKISQSYNSLVKQSLSDDNPLQSGNGFEHITKQTSIDSGLSYNADILDLGMNMSNDMADWDPFFPSEDIDMNTKKSGSVVFKNIDDNMEYDISVDPYSFDFAMDVNNINHHHQEVDNMNIDASPSHITTRTKSNESDITKYL